MAYITTIGANPDQIEYRLSQAHGCGGPGGTDRQFSYHADGRERPLRWIGSGLSEVGIQADTELTEEQFDAARRLMNGCDPRTGEELVSPKRAVPDDAKVPVGPLVRAVEAMAAEANVSVEDVLASAPKKIVRERFERAQRAVASRGEAARLRADHAGEVADALGIPVPEVWDDAVYSAAAENLFETVMVEHDDGSVGEEQRPRRVIAGNAGYDITFTLPKSFSTLLAFADAETAARVERTYMDGVQRTFSWLESITAYGMRGWHGDGHTADTVPGTGLLGWTMVHRAARPTGGAEVGDPHWHVHLTVANMTRGDDGRWSTIAAGGRDLMRHAPAVDHIVKALVRRQLHEQQGIRFGRNARTGAWEIVGIPDETLRQFSKRDADIRRMLDRLGYDTETVSRTEKRIVEQRTRGKKSETIAAADETLQQLWQAEESDAGRDPDAEMRDVFGAGSSDSAGADDGPDAPTDPLHGGTVADGAISVEEIAAQLRDPETGLTSHSRRFTRAETLAAVADALPYGCADTDELERLTDAVLACVGFRELPQDAPAEGPNGQRAQLAEDHMANATRYTTQDVVDVETTILRTARASHAEQMSTRVSTDVVELALQIVEAGKGFPLDGEQRWAVERVVTRGCAVDAVTGRPGSGKTTMMQALRMAYEQQGYVVAGAATAAVAAQNLQTESGIHSRTVAALLHAHSTGQQPLRGVDVVVLDEANLTEDRDRAQLYQIAQHTGTKLVEVGDGKQLRGVGIGSLFSRVHEIVDGAELRNNRRQADEDERAAIEAWRDGRYAEAFSIWQGRGAFHACEDADEATMQMVALWQRYRQGAPNAHTEMRGLVMLASTNAQLRRINDAAQAVRAADGELGDGRTYDVAGGDRVRVHVGEHVTLRLNDRAGTFTTGPPVLNGYRAVVTALDEHGRLTVEWERETRDGWVTETAALSPEYVAADGVELGYSLTIHRAEGLTIGGPRGRWTHPDGQRHDGRVLFRAPGADNSGAYVALSRHKHSVDLVGSLEELESEQQRYLLGAPRTRAEIAERAIDRLAEHARTTETHGDDRPVVADLGLAEFRSEHTREWAGTVPADPLHNAGRDAARATAEQRRAERQRAQAEREKQHQQCRDWAELVLRHAWQNRPSVVEVVLAADAFDVVAGNLAAAHESGYDLDEVLDEIPTRRLETAQDPARMAAWSVDHAVHRLRTGHAQRDAEREQRRAEWTQTRDQAAELLDDMWGDQPELTEQVVTSPAFDAVVRGLDEATEAGLDPRELLAHLNRDRLADPAIRDVGAYAAYSLRRVAGRQIEENHEAERRADAAAALRHSWQHAPQAVEAVLSGPAFRFVADELAQLRTHGHDPESVLSSLSPDVLLAAPQPAGATAHALKQKRRHRTAVEQEPPAPASLSEQQHDRLVATARAAVDTAPTTSAAAEHTTERDASSDPDRARLATVTAAAAEYYQQQLAAHPAEQDYLTSRLPNADAARAQFTLGYAPHEWRSATEHLRHLGYSDQDLLDAGIAKHARNGGLIDRLRGRIVLAVRDEHGTIAGFIGRDRTGEEHPPKYLNTPATELYDKSRIVFGLYEQRERLAAGATPVLVEGTFDVMALSTSDAGQWVVPVTTSGTAVTTHHLDVIGHATGRNDLVIGLDGDEAGQSAAARAADRALQLGLDTRIVTLPNGHDPASWVHAHAAPQRAAEPYRDPAQQHPAGDLLADRAIETYFAAHPPQHRDEVEGHLAAIRTAAAALRHVPLDQASQVGVRLAHQWGLNPVEVAGMLAQARTVPTEPLTAPSPDPHTEPEPPATTVEPTAGEPQDTATPAGDDNGPPPDLPTPVWAADPATVPDWRVREHGTLTDQQLHTARTAAAEHREQLRQRAEQASYEADQLRDQVQAGRGPAITALDEHQDHLRQQAETARQADELDDQRQTTVDRAAEAAAQRAHAETEREELSRLASKRRRELDTRIEELRGIEDTAQDQAEQQAAELAPLAAQVGDRDERRHLHTRARAVDADDQHARPRAHQHDEQRLAAADRTAARTAAQLLEHEQRETTLAGETRLREQLPHDVHQLEETERAQTATPTPAEVTAGHEQQTADSTLDWETRPELDHQAQQEINDEPEL